MDGRCQLCRAELQRHEQAEGFCDLCLKRQVDVYSTSGFEASGELGRLDVGAVLRESYPAGPPPPPPVDVGDVLGDVLGEPPPPPVDRQQSASNLPAPPGPVAYDPATAPWPEGF